MCIFFLFFVRRRSRVPPERTPDGCPRPDGPHTKLRHWGCFPSPPPRTLHPHKLVFGWTNTPRHRNTHDNR